MLALRPMLVRLLAAALVLAGAGGIAARAPQTLRTWVDVAADVAPVEAGAAARHRPAATRPALSRIAPADSAALSRIAPADSDHARPATTAGARAIAALHAALATAKTAAPLPAPGPTWPGARDGRGVLDLKSARLI
jgi:hypothetical protein